MSKGVVLVGIGGSGRIVVDGALKLLGEGWQSEGVIVRLIDVIGPDEKAVMLPGRPLVEYGTSEDRFVLSSADCEPVVLAARTNGRPAEFPWLDRETAQRITPPLPGTGCGGDRLASHIIARLGRAAISDKLESAVAAARGQIGEIGTNPTVFVIAGGAGGVGSGHMPVVLEELLRLSDGDIDCIPIMLSGAYANPLFLDEVTRNQAWERAIALQRELDLFDREALQLRFIVGGGPDAYANAAPDQGLMAATSLWLATFIENQSTYLGSRPNWAGTDHRDARPAERHSTLGAARLAYRADLVASWLSKTIAAEAWELVAKPTDAAGDDGRRRAEELLGRLDIGATANLIAGTDPSRPVLLAQLEVDAVETLMGSISPSEDAPRVIDLIAEVGSQLPRIGGLRRAEVVDLADTCARRLRDELDDYVSAGRRDWRRTFTDFLRDELDELFNGSAQGLIVGADPQRLIRVSANLRAVADTFDRAAARIESTRDEIEDQVRPMEAAEKAVAEAHQQLPENVNRRQAKPYLAARDRLAFCERWRTVAGAAADLCRNLAAVAVEAAQPAERWIAQLNDFAAGARAAAGQTQQVIRDLDLRPSLTLVPTCGTDAFRRFAEAIRIELAEASSDVAPAKAALEELRWVADLSPGHPDEWGLLIKTPSVSEHQPAQDGWVYNNGASRSERISFISPVFLWEMIERGGANGIGVRNIAERFSLYDALAADYRSNFSPQHDSVVRPELVERFVAGFRNRLFDTSEALAPFDGLRPGGATVNRPIRHTFYFVDPGAPRRTATDPDDAPSLGERIRDALLKDLGNSEQEKRAYGAPRELTRLVVVNRVHSDLFREPRPHLSHYYVSQQPVHPVPAAIVARKIERVAREQRRLNDRLLDTEVVQLLAHADALRDVSLLLALGGLPKRDDPDHPTAYYQLYELDVRRSGRPVTVALGRNDQPIAVIRTAMLGPDAADLRPVLSELFARHWRDFAAGYPTREQARQALGDLVWSLDLPEDQSGIDRQDLHMVIAILATEDI